MHKILLKTLRNGYLDTCFYGSLFHTKENEIIFSFGQNIGTIAFMRSLAKPFQSSIIFDDNFIDDYKITSKEVSIFSGSHAGSMVHIDVLKKFILKHKIKINDLSLSPTEPLDKRDYKNHKTKLHNNCSGKHLMMLSYSNYKGFNKDYTNPNHPIQILIKQKQENLTEFKSDILTFDGCSTPLWGLPYKNITKGYFNLVNFYPSLIKAIIKNPYIYGGFNRLDTEIINLGHGKLFSKVGAGGFVLIYNLDKNEILLIKMAQDNNETRRIIALNYLNKLGWIKYETDLNIYNQKKQIVAKYDLTLR